MVVDDDAELRFILRPHMHAAGFEVLEATEGAEAVKMATQHQPDLIIMDIGLPVMDGITAARVLKADEKTQDIPIIMLTGRSSTEDVIRGLEAGAQEYVLKPFEVAELMARVQTVHRMSTATKALDRINTELEAQVDVKKKRLQQLYDFMRELNRASTRDRILDLTIDSVRDMTGARRLSLLLVNDTGQKLTCVRAVGIDPALAERIAIRSVEGIAGKVFQSGKTLAAKTYGTSSQSEQDYDRDAFVCTPLVSTSLETQGNVIGVLNATDKENDTLFADEEIECIRSVADATAIALDNVTRQRHMQQSVRILLRTVGHLAEFRDEETTHHLERVSRLSRILATELAKDGPYASQVTGEFVDSLVQAAPMHDIGKVGVPDDILTKPGKLSDEEFQIMKTHTDIGRRVLSQALDPAYPVPLLQMCIDISYCHHERYDGRGYPRRIAGQEIPLAARIIALVDAYDAITSQRRYKDARSHGEAVEIVRDEANAHFDAVLVDAFLRCHDRFNEVRVRYSETPEPVPA